jgi:hypothetical protein
MHARANVKLFYVFQLPRNWQESHVSIIIMESEQTRKTKRPFFKLPSKASREIVDWIIRTENQTRQLISQTDCKMKNLKSRKSLYPSAKRVSEQFDVTMSQAQLLVKQCRLQTVEGVCVFVFTYI